MLIRSAELFYYSEKNNSNTVFPDVNKYRFLKIFDTTIFQLKELDKEFFRGWAEKLYHISNGAITS